MLKLTTLRSAEEDQMVSVRTVMPDTSWATLNRICACIARYIFSVILGYNFLLFYFVKHFWAHLEGTPISQIRL